jgi:DNA-binding response OmpR family regulator
MAINLFGRKKIVKRVLLVEDDALLSKVMAESLKDKSLDIQIVDNGLQVADAVKKFKPDIILLDLILPGIDGFEVLKNLKADDATKDIPVAVLSNLSDVSDVTSTKALGADEFFIKANTEMDKVVKYIKAKLKI